MKLNESISKVIELLQKLLDGDNTILDNIDQITFDIIADDEFDKLPNDVQDELYLLNNFELENPSKEQLLNAKDVLSTHISK